MSLDLYLECPHCGSGGKSFNVTHNLSRLAAAVGLGDALWAPERAGITTAGQLVGRIEEGLSMLRATPERFRHLEAPNGWGTLDQFVAFLGDLLAACRESPQLSVRASG